MNSLYDAQAYLIQPEWGDLLRDPADVDLFQATSAALEAGSLVRCFRAYARLSEAALADRVGLSEIRIIQIEGAEGDDVPTYALLRKLAFACGINLTEHLITSLAPDD